MNEDDYPVFRDQAFPVFDAQSRKLSALNELNIKANLLYLPVLYGLYRSWPLSIRLVSLYVKK